MQHFQLPGRSPAMAANGMVATSHPVAAFEALSVMRAGGNAVDAALAGAVCLGVCEPHMCGLGGDLFALIKRPGSEDILAVNGSGRAPRGVDVEAARRAGPRIEPGSPASITLPGAVDAICAMAEREGRIGLDRVLAPAIRLYDEGVPIAPRVAHDLGALGDRLDAAARRHYLKDGRPYRLGERFALPAQARLLSRIASEGRAAFYEGAAAEDMVAALQAHGARHELEDFAAVETDWGTPLSGPYRDLELVEHPPNGQGATAILLAGILSHFDIASLDPVGAQRAHVLIEAIKLAYDARNRIIADADHVARLDWMLDPATAGELAGLIRPDRAMPDPAALTEAFHRDTVLIVAVDPDGGAAAVIYSIFASFGSGVASDAHGILFHNRGCGFTLEDGHPNVLGPGKRPMHTIIPAMTRRDGRVDMVFGVMGGPYQAAGHGHVLSNIVDFAMDPQAALDAPRLFAEDGEVRLEAGYSDAVAEELAELGHRIVRPPTGMGGGQAIRIDRERGCLIGGSDPRKDGCAIGW